MIETMNFERARFNMIEQQIRPWNVLDQKVLDVIGNTPREHFVPERYRNLAYSDTRIPLGHDQVMMNPNVEGRLLQALSIKPSDSALEIGTGSGYLTACLAQMAQHVTSVDIFPDLTENARKRLAEFGVTNVTLRTGDAAKGWHTENQYDVIAITGSMPEIPKPYIRTLSSGGRLFVVVGESTRPIMEAMLVTRIGANDWAEEDLFETTIPPLLNASKPKEFVF